jgi:hypothetical protein
MNMGMKGWLGFDYGLLKEHKAAAFIRLLGIN